MCSECPDTRRRAQLCHGLEAGQRDPFRTPYNVGKCPRRVLIEQPGLLRVLDTYAACNGELGPDFDQRPSTLVEGVSALSAGRGWRLEQDTKQRERSSSGS